MFFGNSLSSLPFEQSTHCGGSVSGHRWMQVTEIPSLFLPLKNYTVTTTETYNIQVLKGFEYSITLEILVHKQ